MQLKRHTISLGKMNGNGIIILLILFFTSCSGDEVQKNYQLSVQVNNYSLVQSLVNPYDNTNFFSNGAVDDGYAVRTTFLLYDSSGSLVSQVSTIKSSFSENVSVSKVLENGQYTVISIVDVVYNNLDYCWTFKNLSNLSSASITMASKIPGINGILGFHKDVVTINGSAINLSVAPQHLGALYVFDICNVNYSTIRYVAYKYYLTPDTYLINTGTFSTSGSYYSSDTFDDGGVYSEYYDYKYLLPNSKLAIEDDTYDKSNKLIKGPLCSYANVAAGQHKILKIDIGNSTYISTTLASVKSSSSLINKSYLKTNNRVSAALKLK